MRLQRFYWFLFGILPIAVFYSVVSSMSVNVPYQDDFDGLFEPILNYQKQSASVVNFWKEVYKQDDERRIVVDRLVAFGINKFQGHLDLRTMMFLGSLMLLVLTIVLAQWFKDTGRPWLLFLPVILILYNIQFYEAIFWAMIPFQHLAVYIWSFLTLWLISRGSNRELVFAVLTAVIGIYSDVTGAFVIIPAVLFLGIQARWKQLVAWVGVVGLVVFFYFLGLEVPEYRPDFSESFTDPVLFMAVLFELTGLWADPGTTFPMNWRIGVSIVVGVVGSLGLVLLFWKQLQQFLETKKMDRNELFLWGGILYVAIVFGTLAIGRSSEGLEGVVNPRYRHMYVYWLIFLYLLVIWKFPSIATNKKQVAVIWVLAIAFCINGYYQYWGALDKYRKTLLVDGYSWVNNRAIPSSPIYLALRERVDTIYEAIYEQGIYKGENYPFGGLVTVPVKGDKKIQLQITDDVIVATIEGFERGVGKNDGAYILLKSDKEVHILPAYNAVNPLYRLLKGQGYYSKGAVTEPFVKEFLTQKVYNVEIGIIEGSESYRLRTDQQIIL